MNVGLDTSVVLRLLVGVPADQAAAAAAFLDDVRRRGDQAVVSDLVVAETYYALQFHYDVTKADALKALASLVATGEIAAIGEAGSILTQTGLARAKPGFVDRLIHAAYTGEGGGMATFEKAGGRLPGTTVLE